MRGDLTSSTWVVMRIVRHTRFDRSVHVHHNDVVTSTLCELNELVGLLSKPKFIAAAFHLDVMAYFIGLPSGELENTSMRAGLPILRSSFGIFGEQVNRKIPRDHELDHRDGWTVPMQPTPPSPCPPPPLPPSPLPIGAYTRHAVGKFHYAPSDFFPLHSL